MKIITRSDHNCAIICRPSSLANPAPVYVHAHVVYPHILHPIIRAIIRHTIRALQV